MKAVEPVHTVPPDEVMAYLDGELPPDRAAAVHAHVDQCASCQALVSELRQVSRDMASWRVGEPAGTLRPPIDPIARNPAPRRWFAWWPPAFGWRLAGVSVGVVALGVVWFTAVATRIDPRLMMSDATAQPVPPEIERSRTTIHLSAATELPGKVAGRTPQAVSTRPAASPKEQLEAAAEALRAPKIIRTASLTILANDFDAVRSSIDRVVREVGGFVGQMQASDASAADRSLRAVLRVPAARLEDAVRTLRTLGRVVDESQSGDDVTEQLQDLETRLANSRNTEKRLNDVLRTRTGDVADVLQVEREIARVREEIERMDAERTNLERRVTYATVTLQITEPRKATLELSPLPVSARLRNAFVDGVRDAYESGVDVILWALRVAPVLLLWTAVLWWPVRAVVRTLRTRAV